MKLRWQKVVGMALLGGALVTCRSPKGLLPYRDILLGEPFTPLAQMLPDGLRQTEQFTDALRDYLVTKQAMDPRISLVSEGIIGDGIRYAFAAGGLKYCEGGLRANFFSDGSSPLILGKAPDSPPPDTTTTIGDKNSLSLLKQKMGGAIEITHSMHCIHAGAEGPAAAVMKISFKNDEGLNHVALINNEGLISITPDYLGVDGVARIYAQNPDDGKLIDLPLTGLKGDGTLTSDHFTTRNFDLTPRAQRSDNKFIFTIKDNEFSETSLFANANRILSFFQKYGQLTDDKEQIKIVAHARLTDPTSKQVSVNNAIYNYAAGTAPASIYVGDGDGIGLVNLPYDQTVISHEYSHHFIYKTVTDIAGVSLVIHEGLADFFTMMLVESPCIGPSICPKNGSAQMCVSAQCLRSGLNSYTLEKTAVEAHRLSQGLSGMLWDLFAKDKIPAAKLTDLVMKATALLPTSPSLQSLIGAMLNVDKRLNDGKYCPFILHEANARKIDLADVTASCTAATAGQTLAPDQPGADAKLSEPTKSNSINKSKGKCGCGVLACGTTSRLFFVLLLLPLFVAVKRRRLI